MSPARVSQTNLLRFNVAAIVLVSVADWWTRPGVLLGLLLIVPIMLSSLGRDESDIWITSGFAIFAYLVTLVLSRPPLLAASVWLPNRILGTLTLIGATTGALFLHRQRYRLHEHQTHSRRSDELARLLVTLFAHDVRAPIMSALQGFEYVTRCVSDGVMPEREALEHLRDRLRRHLRVADSVLSIVRYSEDTDPANHLNRVAVDLVTQLKEEIGAFSSEASARGMRLLVELDEIRGILFRIDFLVLRQALSVLLDNAIRYANPGYIRVSASRVDGYIHIRVQDRGPGLSKDDVENGTHGMGLALQLSRALLEQTGGDLQVEQTGRDGTSFLLIVPAEIQSP